MQFSERRSRRRQQIKLEGGRNPDLYPHPLQFYNAPPTENISLQEFEDFALERLKVLKVVETVGIKHLKTTNNYREALMKDLAQLKKQGVTLKAVLGKKTGQAELTNEEYDERRKDYISHFILRLAYCRSEELRRWFLQQEMDLFRYRFSFEQDKSIETFLALNNLDYKPIPDEERLRILQDLIDSSRDQTSTQVDNDKFYKVPFIEALDLVRGRRVYVSQGYAYVPHSELVVIILSHFRAHLSHALAVTSRALPQLEEDNRLLPMLSGLSKRYLGQDYVNKKPTAGQITADMIDSLSRTHFPLCMSSLHQALRQHHHLKHWGRMQYGLFLKAVGLSLEEAMKFWRMEFTKMMDSDKFEKSYSYGIRHNYGKEGKRADYTPYSCIKIITSNTPGPGDHHGCPFKHTDVDLLRQKLQGLKVSKDSCDEIVDLVKRGHFQLACGRYFEVTHKVDTGFSPNHPNQYFDESLRLESGKIEGSASTPSRGAAVIVKSQSSQSTPGSQARALQPTDKAPPPPMDDFDDFPMSAEEMEAAMEGVEAS